MSTYGYLHGQHVTVNMTEAVFDSVTAGVRHVMVVAVRNISKRGLRVRFTPPRSPAFKLHLQNDVELAPGLQMEAELAYFAETPADVEDLMVIDVGRAGGESERIKIPVRALVPGAKLNFEAPFVDVEGDSVFSINAGGSAFFKPLSDGGKHTAGKVLNSGELELLEEMLVDHYEANGGVTTLSDGGSLVASGDDPLLFTGATLSGDGGVCKGEVKLAGDAKLAPGNPENEGSTGKLTIASVGPDPSLWTFYLSGQPS